MNKIIIDSKTLYDFRKWVAENESDGLVRGLWYDEEDEKFFTTCETFNTEYTFGNDDKIWNLILIRGDNNSKGLQEMCESCNGCTDEFMTSHNIDLDYPSFSELMEKLYWADNKSNQYNITEQEIEQYEEDDSCSWFTNHLKDCCSDSISEWYPIEPVNWGNEDFNSNIEFIEE